MLNAPAQPAYDCGLPDDADGILLLTADHSAAAPPGLQSEILDAVLQQFNSVSCTQLLDTVQYYPPGVLTHSRCPAARSMMLPLGVHLEWREVSLMQFCTCRLLLGVEKCGARRQN